MRSSGVSGLLRPDHYCARAATVTPDLLAAWGVAGILVDLDNTLTGRDADEIPEWALAWARSVQEAGIGVCLVSNNWHRRVSRVAEELGCASVAKALKPLPYALSRGMRLLDVAPSQTAVIGDQVFTDVLGGNLVGATTVLVVPLAGSDLPHTMLLRRVEAWIMSGRTPLCGDGEPAKGPPE